MGRVITATITFEYLVDEEELMAGMSDKDQLEYVKETTIEDISEMVIRYPVSLAEAINIEVKEV